MASQPSLTRRELEVLKLMVPGLRNRQIAEKLCITVGVVEGHVCHIMRKLGATSRTEAVYKATKKGIINKDKEEDND
jgi:DNA-binding NarL/FixJ family response regulator